MATYTVTSGMTLWEIAVMEFGDGTRWRELYVDGVSAAEIDPRTLQIGAVVTTAPETEETATEETPPTEEEAPGAGADTTPPDAPVGDEDYPGIMAGGVIRQIQREGLEDLYVVSYEWPAGSGHFIVYQFDSLEQLENTLGPGWATNPDITFDNSTDESWLTSEGVFMAGDVGEVTGPGNYIAMMNSTAQQAAAAAGITDPGILGDMLSDPEIQRVMAIAADAGWDEDDPRLLAELRKTDYWQNVLYPGIENLYSSTSNPEQAWVEYYRSVEDSFVALGYERDADGTYNSYVGRMLDAGIEDTTWNEYVPVFIRAQSNEVYFESFAKWAEAEYGLEVTFDDWFDIVAGQTPGELADLVELAGLEYINTQLGTGLTDEQIARVAEMGELSEADAAVAFSNYQGILTSLAVNLGADMRYDLTEDEILSLSTGIQAESGRSSEEIKRLAAQAARERGLLDEEKLQFFVGYDPKKGTPFRPGLNPLAPEGA